MKKSNKQLFILLLAVLTALSLLSVSALADEAEEETTVTEAALPEEKAEAPAPLLAPAPAQTPNLAFSTGTGTFNISLSGYTLPEGAVRVRYAVWSAKNGQDDIKWYNADSAFCYTVSLAGHKNETGVFYVHCYQLNQDNSQTLVTGTTVNIEAPIVAEPMAQADDISGNGTKFTVTLKNYSLPSDGKLKAAVWSSEKGQDDIVWYPMTANADGTYGVTITPANHKSTGLFYVHVYCRTTKDIFVDDTTFTAKTGSEEPAFGGTVTTENMNNASGTCDIRIKNVTAPGGIKEVQVPVWSKANQSDIEWYTAEKTAEGEYLLQLDIKNHGGNIGTYNVHVYVKNNAGTKEIIGSTTVKFTDTPAPVPTEPALTCTLSSDRKSVDITLTGASGYRNLKGMLFPVWSAVDGQDDINWYRLSPSADGSYKLHVSGADHSGAGHYIVHVYADCDTQIFVKEASFDLYAGPEEKPEDPEEIAVSVSGPSDGTFTVTVKGVSGLKGLLEVQVPIWCNDNQSDIVWYDAVKEGNDYVVHGKLSDHGSHTGTYKVHVYLKKTNGTKSLAANTTFSYTGEPEKPAAALSAAAISGKDDCFRITLSGYSVSPASVRFAVWSVENGQDDIKWYTAEKDNEQFIYDVNTTGHSGFGKYLIHAYNENTFIKETSIVLSEPKLEPKTCRIANINAENGTFDIFINPGCPDNQIDEIDVPTWCSADQSDIVWYDAQRVEEYSYVVHVNIADHKSHTGNYTAHVYLTYKDGREELICAAVANIPSAIHGDGTLSDYNLSVLRNIIYAVETGGQVYGNCRYNDFTEAYTNSASEYAITIGAGCWYAGEARNLLLRIREADPALFASLDTAGIGYDLDNANWSVYGTDGTRCSSRAEGKTHLTITKGSEKAVCIQNIISTDVGKAVQDSMMDSTARQFVSEAADKGVLDTKALMFCANIRHLGGKSAMVREINTCIDEGTPLTMENIYQSMVDHCGNPNGVGAPLYRSRHDKVVEYINKYAE